MHRIFGLVGPGLVVLGGCGRSHFDECFTSDATVAVAPQRLQAGMSGTVSGIDATVTLPGVQDGSVLVAAAYAQSTGAQLTIDDTEGGTWSVGGGLDVSQCGPTRVQLWYRASSGTGQVSVSTHHTLAASHGMFVLEYAGVSAAMNANASRVAPMTSNELSAGALHLASDATVIALFADSNKAGFTINAGPGFTAAVSDVGFSAFVEDALAAPGDYDPSATFNPGLVSSCWTAAAVALTAL